MKKYFNKKNPQVFLLIFFSLLIFSCTNIINRENTEYFEISGKVFIDNETQEIFSQTNGALQNKIQSQITQNQRSAFPNLTSVKFYYRITASQNGKIQDTAETDSDKGGNFLIKLPYKSGNSVYSLSVEGFSDATKTNKILSGTTTQNFSTTTRINQNISIPMQLTDDSKTRGNGNISLKVKAESGTSVKSIKATFTLDSNTNTKYTITEQNYAEGSTVTLDNLKKSDNTNTTNMSAGTYTCELEFFSGNSSDGNIIYKTVEKITVISGLTTNKWQSSSSTQGEIFSVTQNMTNTFKNKELYVVGTNPQGELKGKTGNDNNTGTFFDPLSTIQKAVDKIKTINDGSSQYTIHVDGTFTANSGENLVNIDETSKTLKLKIICSTSQKATLNANGNVSNRRRVININGNNSTQIALENLEITGGNVSDNGAGIKKQNGNLTIKNCTIKNNNSNNDGGGIYTENNNLVLETGNTIESNTAKDGGGIYVKGGTINSISTNFSNNTANANNGGALYVDSSSTTSAIVTLNTNTFQNNNACYQGGAVFVTNSNSNANKNSEVKIISPNSTTTLSNNYATTNSSGNYGKTRNGEAIYISKGTSLTLENAKISYNNISLQCEPIYMQKDDSSTNNGAILKLGGKIFIDLGDSNTSIKVHIKGFKSESQNASIKITKALDNTENDSQKPIMLKIEGTFNDINEKPIIMEGENYTLTNNDCQKFKIEEPDNWELKLENGKGVLTRNSNN